MVILTVVVPSRSSWERHLWSLNRIGSLVSWGWEIAPKAISQKGPSLWNSEWHWFAQWLLFFFLHFGQKPGTFPFCELLFWKLPFLNLHSTLVCPSFPQLKQELENLGSHNPAIAWANKSALKELVLLGKFVISLVLSHSSKNLKRWMDQCYSSVLLASKGKYILEASGKANPKDRKRR